MKQWWQKKHVALTKRLAQVIASKELLQSNNKALSHLNRTISAERDSLFKLCSALLAAQDALKDKIASLKSSYQSLMEENSTLSAAMQQNLQSSEIFKPLSKSLHPIGGLHKVTDKGNFVFVVGAALLSVMVVLL
jgi:hypothetical protein